MSEGNGAAAGLLTTESVVKAFGGLVAVNDVSFSIPLQSIVSIIGPNGAGKTTFFNMLTGLYKPTAGRISFAGKDITGMRPDKITALGVARTFQNIRLFATMSATENVMVGQHSRMRAGMFGSVLRTPRVRREEKEVAREGARDAAASSACARPSWIRSRRTSPTATSAGWRSRAPWPPIPRCCCWTSRRRA